MSKSQQTAACAKATALGASSASADENFAAAKFGSLTIVVQVSTRRYRVASPAKLVHDDICRAEEFLAFVRELSSTRAAA